MKAIFIFSCFMIVIQSVTGQNKFAKQFTNLPGIQSMLKTSDDGFLIYGSSLNAPRNSDAYVNSFDQNYNSRWSIDIGTIDFETAFDAIETSDKNFFVVGCKSYYSSGQGRAFILYKIDSSGKLLWSRKYDFYDSYDPWTARIIQLNDSSLIIAGMTSSSAYNVNQTVIIKVNIKDGTPVWAKDFFGAFASILKNDDRSFLFVEESIDQHPERNSDIFKIDDGGNIIWHKQIDNVDGEYRLLSMVKADTGFLFTGYFNNTATEKTDLLVLKISDTGSGEWAKSYGTKFNDFGYKIIRTKDSNYVVLGALTTQRASVGGYLDLLKLDKNGNLIWNTANKDTFNIEPHSIFETKDSGFIISVGNFGFLNEDILKTDSKGAFCENESLSFKKREVIVTIKDINRNPTSINVDAALSLDNSISVYKTLITTCESSILPLQLLTFSVNHFGKANLLKWSTAQELNTDRFAIQRSSNSRDFTTIGAMKSYNNGKAKNDYVFTDAHPLKAVNYYRLKMIDKDGLFTYSAIKTVNNNNSFDVAVYPNPVDQTLTLNFNTEKAMNVQIDIVNAEGKKVYNKKMQLPFGASKQNINVAALSSGNYFIKCTTADGQAGLKFIKL